MGRRSKGNINLKKVLTEERLVVCSRRSDSLPLSLALSGRPRKRTWPKPMQCVVFCCFSLASLKYYLIRFQSCGIRFTKTLSIAICSRKLWTSASSMRKTSTPVLSDRTEKQQVCRMYYFVAVTMTYLLPLDGWTRMSSVPPTYRDVAYLLSFSESLSQHKSTTIYIKLGLM